MNIKQFPRVSRAMVLAVAVEFALGVVAVLVGWLCGLNVLGRSVGLSAPTDVAIGMVATIPLTIGMLMVDRSDAPTFRDLRSVVDQSLVPFFAGSSSLVLAMISLAAGVGEELLFRGLIQQGLTDCWPSAGGAALGAWLLTGVLFGLAHSLTRTYALLACVVGLYLGSLFWYFESLLVPITTHTLYDFIALTYLLRTRP